MPAIERSFTTHLVVALAIAAAGLWLRGTLLLTTELGASLRNDAYEYYRYAANLKLCGTYSQSTKSLQSGCTAPARLDPRRPPGYPLGIAPLVEYPPTMGMVLRIQWAQVLLSALTVILVYAVFVRLGGMAVAAPAAALTALSPHLAAMNLYLLSETLFALVLAAFALALGAWCRRPGAGTALAAGALLGLATLVRPTTLYFIVLLAPLLAWWAPSRRAVTLIAVLAGFLVCYGPWFALSHGAPLPEGHTSLALKSINSGTYPDLMVDGRPETRGAQHRYAPGFDDRDTLGEVLAHLLERAREAPLTYLRWYALGKAVTYLGWDIIAGAGDVFVYPVEYPGFAAHAWLGSSHGLMMDLHWPLMCLALAGCAIAWLPARGVLSRPPAAVRLARVLALLIAYFILVHVVGSPLPRYAIPLRPLLYGLACWFLYAAGIALARRVRPPASVSG